MRISVRVYPLTFCLSVNQKMMMTDRSVWFCAVFVLVFVLYTLVNKNVNIAS